MVDDSTVQTQEKLLQVGVPRLMLHNAWVVLISLLLLECCVLLILFSKVWSMHT